MYAEANAWTRQPALLSSIFRGRRGRSLPDCEGFRGQKSRFPVYRRVFYTYHHAVDDTDLFTYLDGHLDGFINRVDHRLQYTVDDSPVDTYVDDEHSSGFLLGQAASSHCEATLETRLLSEHPETAEHPETQAETHPEPASASPPRGEAGDASVVAAAEAASATAALAHDLSA